MKEAFKKYFPHVCAAFAGLILYVCMRMFLFPVIGIDEERDTLLNELELADRTLPFSVEKDGFTFESIKYDKDINVLFRVGFTLEKLDNHFDEESLKKAYADLSLNNVFCGMKLVRSIYDNKGTVTAEIHADGREEYVKIPLGCAK